MMKQLWDNLPRITRWLLVTIVILLVAAGSAYAYVALTTTGEITVQEALSFVGSSTFSVDVYPQESTTASVVVANASSVPLEVDLVSIVTPDPGGKGLTISVPSKVTIPATGQGTIEFTITASKSVILGIYTVTLEISR